MPGCLLGPTIGPRVQAGLGASCFLAFAAAFSTNLRAVRWRTIGVGLFLQIVLASVVLQSTYVQDKFKIAASVAPR